MFQRCFREVSCFSTVLKKVTRCFKVLLGTFQGYFGVFQRCFKEVLENSKGVSNKFHVASLSMQLPKQKEGLFNLK